MKSKLYLFLSTVVLVIIYSSNSLKTKDIVNSDSNVLSKAFTESGNAISQSKSIANADRILVNSINRPDDLVFANSQAKSDSLTGLGDSVGSAISLANAARQELNPVQSFNGDQVVALSGAQTNASTNLGNARAITGTSAVTSNLKYDGVGNVIQAVQNVQYVQNTWFNTGRKVINCDVGGFGDIYCIGEDKRIYYYDILTETHELLKGDFQLEGVVKIAVGNDGSVYAVTVTGETFYYTCKNTWVRIEGCATDIAVGTQGDVYKIGCDVKNGGLGIYKLFCQGDSCFKNCKRHRTYLLTNDFLDDRSCHWFRIEGSGVAITVNQIGQPIVTKVDGSVWSFNGSDWDQMGSINAIDVSCSNDGVLYIVGKDKFLYRQKIVILDKNKNIKKYTYDKITGINNVTSITCGPLNIPFAVSSGTLWNVINTPYN